MRRLRARLLAALETPDRDEDLIPAVGRAIERVRGRPVRLCAVAFPPETASGVWIDRTQSDILAYERHTDPGHQLVIIGHEAWHMFQGHCSSLTAHGSVATRAKDSADTALRDLLEVLAATEVPGAAGPADRTAPRLHIAMRADAGTHREEDEAEFFGVRFATSVQAALLASRSSADTDNLAGRIQASMAHRIRRS
ncbi:toxin-antitoxin system, toxin component [Streptomyces flavalbus]|uniref:Toxin-antitoxin system, toxin component n=1 Tax=Streptomyces flavalbus TaxID=2665155 RepID=A0ABW2WIB6_9ACTN